MNGPAVQPGKGDKPDPQEKLNTPADATNDDANDVAKWYAAAEQAPSVEDIKAASEQVANLEKELETAKTRLAKDAVKRAVVHGWARVADEVGTSARQLHVWHRAHLPNEVDLSDVPGGAMRREERRIESIEKKLASDQQLRKTLDRHRNNLAKLKKVTER